MHRVELRKPDGREMTLYARHPLPAGIQAPSPFPDPLTGGAHLRWHPLRGEWVTYAAHRQDRTFLPPPEYNPLAPTVDAANPTEVPDAPWDVAVFENRFPSLGGSVPPPPDLIVPTAPASGRCEVVVFTQDRQASLGALPLDHVALLLEVWGDRTVRLGADPSIRYVLPFENRGAEVGVTLHHPHGQVYAYPVVPPVPQRMQQVALEHHARHGRGLLETHIEAERRDGARMLYEGPHAVAFVPVCARYPYEVWIAPSRPVPGFAQLRDGERIDLARALKTVLLKYDGLWRRPFPYLMAWYQAPTDGQAHPESHLHAQLWPPYRTRDRLKYLAGTELAAGFFAMDALPEDKARELQQVEARLP
ncbi:galactose-1-phosphate uridylyltransferase [Ramlibacter sp. AW1]|uniref:Galactose-1-phosphate uridylyltransferase n=1 Tax=Ramlibacter aurantiacus TaxID=2801330 RepID=A0A936ZGA7_9BURK|nr:galactose-1-phosphate uridylyltransferase [Ramlibacter aurantiacus]MBL0419728.1 galactose-1-phosphate uridylyltransferase [Ramlibacter aurantiacus]